MTQHTEDTSVSIFEDKALDKYGPPVTHGHRTKCSGPCLEMGTLKTWLMVGDARLLSSISLDLDQNSTDRRAFFDRISFYFQERSLRTPTMRVCKFVQLTRIGPMHGIGSGGGEKMANSIILSLIAALVEIIEVESTVRVQAKTLLYLEHAR